MKNLLFILLLAPISLFGQEIKFMGLDLGTDVDVFCKSLKTKGLMQTVDRFEKKEFVGTFATYNNCHIIVKATETSKKVKSVEVLFESVRDDEHERDNVYKEILKQYYNKYGEKVVSLEYDEVLGVKRYGITDGDIIIEISSYGPSFLSPENCSMSVYYYSKKLLNKKETNPNRYSNDI